MSPKSPTDTQDEAQIPLLAPDSPSGRDGSVSPDDPHIRSAKKALQTRHSLAQLTKLFLLTSLAAFLFFASIRWANDFDIRFRDIFKKPGSGDASHAPQGVLHSPSSQLKQDYNSNKMSGRVVPRPNGPVNVGYFTNWGIYGRNFKPDNLTGEVAQSLTHILYSFANVKENGEVVLTDSWADSEIHFEGDTWDKPGLYGCLGRLFKLKARPEYRHLKVLLSIGGWTYANDQKCFAPTLTPQGRAEFVRSGIQLLEDYGLDGLDLDWEYPQNDQEARAYVDLLRDLRDGLDAHAAAKGIPLADGYELTIAAPAGASNYEKLHAREMDQYLSFWNLMAYDYQGSWSDKAGHQAQLFGKDPSELSTDRAVRWFTDNGVPKEKLVVGVPLYGRSFSNTKGAGHSFSGVVKGSWEAGSYDYKVLPLPNSQVGHDPHLVASWCHTPDGEWVSYDSPEAAAQKADFVNVNGLGGLMYWELSGDKVGEGAIVPLVARKLGRLDSRPNHLHFPGSKWENVRGGMQ